MTRLESGVTQRFERVAVIGVGLIGGSFALALKRKGACGSVVGVGRDPSNMQLARERGVIDAIETDPAVAVRGADFVLVATPVAQLPAVFGRIADSLAPETVITDAGSTKLDVVRAARAALGARIAQFVPAHPIAGGERSGAAAARPDLFDDRRVVIAALPENPPNVVEAVAAGWKLCGARIFRMDASEHDAVLAAVSHLPHLLAFALVHDVSERANSRQLFGYAGSGFRDFTRIASSNPEMWRDICTANHTALIAELDRYLAKLQALRQVLSASDATQLEKVFAAARDARHRWLAGEFDL